MRKTHNCEGLRKKVYDREGPILWAIKEYDDFICKIVDTTQGFTKRTSHIV